MVLFSCSSGQLSGLDHCEIGYRWATTGMPAGVGRTDTNAVRTTRNGEIPRNVISRASAVSVGGKCERGGEGWRYLSCWAVPTISPTTGHLEILPTDAVVSARGNAWCVVHCFRLGYCGSWVASSAGVPDYLYGASIFSLFLSSSTVCWFSTEQSGLRNSCRRLENEAAKMRRGCGYKYFVVSTGVLFLFLSFSFSENQPFRPPTAGSSALAPASPDSPDSPQDFLRYRPVRTELAATKSTSRRTLRHGVSRADIHRYRSTWHPASSTSPAVNVKPIRTIHRRFPSPPNTLPAFALMARHLSVLCSFVAWFSAANSLGNALFPRAFTGDICRVWAHQSKYTCPPPAHRNNADRLQARC